MSGRFPEFVASRFPEGTKRRLQSLARAFDHKGLTIYERRATALELETGERLLDTDLTDCKTDEESS